MPVVVDILLKEGKKKRADQNYIGKVLRQKRFWNLEFIKLVIRVITKSGSLIQTKSETKGSQGANNNLLLAAAG